MSRRGGLGVRHAASARIAQSSAYRLIGVPAGSSVAETDKYRRWHLYYRVGTIMRVSSTSVTVQWEDEPEFSHYTAEEARYRVDTNWWRITPPTSRSPLDALTSGPKSESIMPSPPIEGSPTREEIMTQPLTAADVDKMKLPELRIAAEAHFEKSEVKGLKKAQLVELLKSNLEKFAPVDDEVDDEIDDEVEDTDDELDEDELDDEEDDTPEPNSDDEEDEELDEVPAPKAKGKATAAKADKPSTPPAEPSGETYTAKQVATRIGTDAKTLRKFFRSPASTIEPCGQGGRYEFAKEDLPTIKAEFTKWNTAKPTRTPAAKGPKASKREVAASTGIVEVEEDLELDDDEELDDEEPTTEALADLELEGDDEDDELDDDELDD